MGFYGDTPLKIVSKKQLQKGAAGGTISGDGTAKGGDIGGTTEGALGDCQANCDRKYPGRFNPSRPERRDADMRAWQACMDACAAKEKGKKIPVVPKEAGGCGKGKVTSGSYPNGRDWEGCPCSAAYFPNEGEGCMTGYTATGSGADYRCECDKYDREVPPEGDGKEKLGEFNWPTEMSDYYGQLMGRGRELLNKKPGYGEAIMKMMLGQGIDLARGGEVGKRQAMQADLASEGLLGTGAGINALRVLPSETEAGISNLSREIQFQNEAQKRKDTELWTTLADKLFGTGMGYHTTREAINAGRRGEGLTAQALWIEYLKALLSSWKG